MKIFLSFAYDEDRDQVNGFRSMLENPRANINFVDGSCKKDYAGKTEKAIKTYINSLIESSSVTVCLISARTKTSKWVDWELKSSSSKAKGIVGIVLKDRHQEITNVNQCPNIFHSGRYKVYHWAKPEELTKYIETAEDEKEKRK